MTTGSPTASIPDVQSRPDTRGLAIDQVGIGGLRLPITVADKDGVAQPTVGTFRMTVGLPKELKGTHMSRFLEIMEEHEGPLGVTTMEALLPRVAERLQADDAEVSVRFPYFMTKRAPVTGTESRLDYEVELTGAISQGVYRQSLKVQVGVTTLCPCSKQISEYGAHNQRGEVRVTLDTAEPVWIEELIKIVEANGSCELWGVLKRPDEKWVTEAAYDNPKFVEDVVRDVALALQADPRVRRFEVEVENFESIHNHQAYAKITGPV